VGLLLATAFLSASLAAPRPTAAQIVPFGKNKIQYQRFDWHVLPGEHVDVYFYPEEAEVAQVALREAERAYADLEVKFNYHPTERIPLIIYSSHLHFEQTNVLGGFIPEGVAGFTEYLKGRVALPFNGSYHDFQHVIAHELVHVFQLRKMTHERDLHSRGGSLGLPQWFTEGLAEHWSSEWGPEGNLFVGDFVLSGRLPHIQELYVYNGTFAIYKLGQSVHDFLGREFGEERMAFFLESLWKYKSLDSAFKATYGLTLDELDARWRYDLEQRYYPLVSSDTPLELAAQRVITKSRANFKPTVVPRPDGPPSRFCYVSPRTGFTDIYCADLDGVDGNVETVLETERRPEFESIHGFTSSLDANARGELAFVSKYGESDALFVLDLSTKAIRVKRRFPDLVALSSPSWDPAGEALAFVGLSKAGFSDVYVYHIAADSLERLTQSRFLEEDPAWSPDGGWVVYATDSIPGGDQGYKNLVALELATGSTRALTMGPWRDTDPRWSPDGRHLVFTSDRSGLAALYEVDLEGNGRRLLRSSGGVLDGEPFLTRDPDGTEREALLFAGYENGQASIWRLMAPEGGGENFALPPDSSAMNWSWRGVLPDSGQVVATAPYRRRFSLDLAQGGTSVGGNTSVEAAQALFSDFLGDHLILLELYSITQDLDNLFENIGGEVTYLNLKQRVNWGATAYRSKADYLTNGTLNSPPELFQVDRYGAGGILSYPLSKFRRVEGRLNVEHNDTFGIGESFEGGVVDRVGIIGISGASYIKDNTLWLPTGPIDGERYNVSLGGTVNLSEAEPESYFAVLDYRRYFRLGLQSAYAVRGQFLYSDGLIPVRFVMGGSGTLRGFPRFELRGSRYALVNQELRFPLLTGLAFGTPIFGALRFPGVQGALFLDMGNAWEEVEQEELGFPGVLGSFGLGLRMSLGGPLVMRLDFSRLFEIDDKRDLRVFEDKNRIDFFIGFNY
jgi:Tol biopolymer transport system component